MKKQLNQNPDRETLKRDVERFLKKGGRIRKISTKPFPKKESARYRGQPPVRGKFK